MLRASCYGVYDRRVYAHNEIKAGILPLDDKLPFDAPAKMIVSSFLGAMVLEGI